MFRRPHQVLPMCSTIIAEMGLHRRSSSLYWDVTSSLGKSIAISLDQKAEP
ncbi:hypothetical protein POX_b03244 [Penicillium oxalicum]|uniref:hypothetical protein n=1 Tax=Penicillium oxalicum TaxID=69781 RepID=UPI0020B79E17|nr:hypothetical protein POX_b03244 [Penicillium oxalicum]KAI2793194.1 hypothetical protein POX_b03244 [Penicillium oxalicum]